MSAEIRSSVVRWQVVGHITNRRGGPPLRGVHWFSSNVMSTVGRYVWICVLVLSASCGPTQTERAAVSVGESNSVPVIQAPSVRQDIVGGEEIVAAREPAETSKSAVAISRQSLVGVWVVDSDEDGSDLHAWMAGRRVVVMTDDGNWAEAIYAPSARMFTRYGKWELNGERLWYQEWQQYPVRPARNEPPRVFQVAWDGGDGLVLSRQGGKSRHLSPGTEADRQVVLKATAEWRRSLDPWGRLKVRGKAGAHN